MDLDVTLRCLFDAENARDWAVCADLLHPDVTWTLAELLAPEDRGDEHDDGGDAQGARPAASGRPTG